MMNNKTILFTLSFNLFCFASHNDIKTVQKRVRTALLKSDTIQMQRVLEQYDKSGATNKRNATDFAWINRADCKGMTLLLYAINSGDVEGITTLLQYGATVNKDVITYARQRVSKEVLFMIVDAVEDQESVKGYYKNITGQKRKRS